MCIYHKAEVPHGDPGNDKEWHKIFDGMLSEMEERDNGIQY